MAGNANANHTIGIEIQDVIEYPVNTSSTNDINKLYLVQFFIRRKTEVARNCINFDSAEGNYYESISKFC